MTSYIYIYMHVQLKKSLAQASSVAITTDGATMKNTGDSYIAITGHWITPGWKLISAVLGVKISDGKVVCACVCAFVYLCVLVCVLVCLLLCMACFL